MAQDTADPPGPPLQERHDGIDQETITRWAGDRMDRHYAVSLFMLDDPLPPAHGPPGRAKG